MLCREKIVFKHHQSENISCSYIENIAFIGADIVHAHYCPYQAIAFYIDSKINSLNNGYLIPLLLLLFFKYFLL